MDAHSSQSFTIKDARTHTEDEAKAIGVEGKDYSFCYDYNGNKVIVWHASHRVWKLKDTPVYPEPEGDPSY